jgi:hypothetical protein
MKVEWNFILLVQFKDLEVAVASCLSAYEIIQTFPVLVPVGNNVLIRMVHDCKINGKHGYIFLIH